MNQFHALPPPGEENRALWEAGIQARHLKARLEGEILLITATTHQLLDDVVAGGFQEELMAATTQSGCGKVVVDFGEVKAVGNAAYQALAQLQQRLRGERGRLVVCGLSAPVAEVFRLEELAGEDRASGPKLTIAPDAKTAVAEVHAPRAG